MSIQWFPGHMNVTRKAIAERVPEIDVVIELLDARLPGSSANPMLAEMTAGDSGIGYLIMAHTAFCIPFAYLPIRARLDETRAAPQPVLRWTPGMKVE